MSDFRTWEELTEVEQLQSMYSDSFKDVYGFRPRSSTDEQWNSAEWLKQQMVDLEAEYKRVVAEEASEEQANIATFEANVAALCESMNKDRETIVRWMFDGSDSNGDWDYYCFNLGIPYGYFRELYMKEAA